MFRSAIVFVWLFAVARPTAGQAPYRVTWSDAGSVGAAGAFAPATTYLVIARREQLPHRARNAILLYAGAVGVAALRVTGGKHFPTDVAGGAVLGSGIGWLTATVHARVP